MTLLLGTRFSMVKEAFDPHLIVIEAYRLYDEMNQAGTITLTIPQIVDMYCKVLNNEVCISCLFCATF